MSKSVTPQPTEQGSSGFRILRKSVRVVWILFVLAIACYSIQGIVRFPHALQPLPEPMAATNDSSLEQAMCMLDFDAINDPDGTWQFDVDADSLLPFPNETKPQGSRLDRHGEPVFQFFAVEMSSEPLVAYWKSNGWTVKEYEASSGSSFFVQCVRADQTLNVWSTDSPQQLHSLVIFKGQ